MSKNNIQIKKVKYPLPQVMKWLLISVTIFLILATATVIFALAYANAYSYRFFSGVKINNQPLKNLSHAQAIEFWQAKVDNFAKQGLKYHFNNKEITIFPTLPATDPDVSYKLISFDVPKTVDEAYFIGRRKGYRKNFQEQMLALTFGKNIPLEFQFDAEEFLIILKQNLNKFITPKKEARPQIKGDLTIDILPEATGTNFDYQKILLESLDKIHQLSSEPIELNLIIDGPKIKKDEISDLLKSKLKDKLAAGSLTLIYKDDKWKIPNVDFKDWFSFIKQDEGIILSLDASTTKAYLKKNIAPDIYRPTLEAKFEIKNGRVIEFQGSQDGVDLDIEKTLEKLIQDFVIDNQAEVELVVTETKVKVTTASVNDLGISRIIGIGHSNFKGSPKNRRHNIAVGAESLNGILIKSGETFSLIKALGKVDSKHGYKPELVIKGDETIPEYGGGLCQIGTTMFRVALASGLPIVERYPHSYRVVYYEPAGKDATIYDPRPDLKFTNDTKSHILIQSRIEGDDLYFDFWGTSDGRIAEQTDSVIYNIKSPGGTVYIETDELEQGEEKCIETPHAGADAYFDYKVTYADGTVNEERFTSHYIPWPKKCLVGKEPDTATTTEEIIEDH